jgi:hypothetical protein
VADADQTFRQDVKKESAQELICGNGHDLVLAAVGIVSPAEWHAIVLEGHESMVGDGDAMGIARQVVENVLGAAEGWLDVNDPVLLAELLEEAAECAQGGKLLEWVVELESVLVIQFTEFRAELSAEDLAEYLDG